jgi:phosphotransferase system enzyme I (PtsI)
VSWTTRETPEILRSQLRAVLRLSATHPVAILFPMVGGMEDLFAAKAAIESAKASLAAERKPFNPRVPVGAISKPRRPRL